MADIKGYFNSLYQRIRNGDHYNFIESIQDSRFGLTGSNLDVAQNHPILTPALLFVSKVFSQASIYGVSEYNDKKITDNNYIELLKNPNHYQTSIDFLETLYFMMIAQGYSVVYKKRVPGGVNYNSIYVLNPALIEWPEGFKSTLSSRKLLSKKTTKVVYDRNGENIIIDLNDLLFFYDLPNALQKNIYKAKSRIDGLRQTLENTTDSLIAKNIILKTNGKELISSKTSGTPLTPEEKLRIENIYQSNYGLSKTRKRAIITRADVSHKSLHIALRDLGLDESIKVDGNLIYTALHIPKDILSLEAKKTTYNNYKESMVSFIQNEIQGTLDYVLGVFQKDANKKYPDLKIKGNYKHLPVMQFVLLEQYKVVKTIGEALKSLRVAGLPDDVALEMCELDTSIKLAELNKKEDEPKEDNK